MEKSRPGGPPCLDCKTASAVYINSAQVDDVTTHTRLPPRGDPGWRRLLSADPEPGHVTNYKHHDLATTGPQFFMTASVLRLGIYGSGASHKVASISKAPRRGDALPAGWFALCGLYARDGAADNPSRATGASRGRCGGHLTR